jgi:hypothetical protein
MHAFSSTKLDEGEKRWGQGGEMTHTMYAHVNKKVK